MDELTELEEAFFLEGDRMSREAEAVVQGELIDLTSRMHAAVDVDYYASIALTIESDEVSGGFEVISGGFEAAA